MRKIILLLTACILSMTSAYAALVGSVVDNLRTGALFNSIGNLGKNSVFLWYTTVAGELNPAYASQRMVVDWFLFFTILMVVIKYSISKMWPDMEKSSKNLLILALPFACATGMVSAGISFGLLLKYIGNIAAYSIGMGIALALNKMFNKDKSAAKTLGFIVLGVVLSVLLASISTLSQGSGFTLSTGLFNTEKKSDLSARVIVSGSGQTNDPVLNYQLALEAVQAYDYEKAKGYFEQVIAYGPANNPSYKKTAAWITQSEGDLLFKHMARNYPAIMDAERAAANILLDKAEKLKQENGDSAQIKALAEKARRYTVSVIEKEMTLKKEIARRKA